MARAEGKGEEKKIIDDLSISRESEVPHSSLQLRCFNVHQQRLESIVRYSRASTLLRNDPGTFTINSLAAYSADSLIHPTSPTSRALFFFFARFHLWLHFVTREFSLECLPFSSNLSLSRQPVWERIFSPKTSLPFHLLNDTTFINP